MIFTQILSGKYSKRMGQYCSEDFMMDAHYLTERKKIMNKTRRKTIYAIAREINNDNIEEMLLRLQDVYDDEQYAFDSMPENLQYSMRGEESQDCIASMESAISILEEIIDGNHNYDIDDVVSELKYI